MRSKEELIPELEKKAFVDLNGNIWQCTREGKKYIVDFKNNEVCIAGGADGLDRLYDVPYDDFLCRIQALCDYVVEPTADDVPEKVKAEICEQPDEPYNHFENMNGQGKVEVIDPCTLPALTNADIVRPAVTAAQAIAAWDEFQQLKKAVINKSDLQRIGDKDFVKKSGWRKLAQYFNLTDEITEETREPLADGKGWVWTIKVRCIAANGRTTEGVGKCASNERKFAHIEHDTYATAHTRAKNRAISDMIAAGEVSAEEVQG